MGANLDEMNRTGQWTWSPLLNQPLRFESVCTYYSTCISNDTKSTKCLKRMSQTATIDTASIDTCTWSNRQGVARACAHGALGQTSGGFCPTTTIRRNLRYHQYSQQYSLVVLKVSYRARAICQSRTSIVPVRVDRVTLSPPSRLSSHTTKLGQRIGLKSLGAAGLRHPEALPMRPHTAECRDMGV